jgi:hypothetical protein
MDDATAGAMGEDSPSVSGRALAPGELGSPSDPELDDLPSQTFTFATDDERFEIADSMLKLKPDEYLDSNSPITITITATGSGTDPDILTQTLQIEIMENPTPWQNKELPWDTNGDRVVVPLDALRLINQLNDPILLQSGGRLPSSRPAGTTLPLYDVNGDGFATTNDVLRIFNYLIEMHGDGEAESADETDFVRFNALLVNLPGDAKRLDASVAPNQSAPKRRPVFPFAVAPQAITVPVEPSTKPMINETWEELDDILDDIASDVTDAWEL